MKCNQFEGLSYYLWKSLKLLIIPRKFLWSVTISIIWQSDLRWYSSFQHQLFSLNNEPWFLILSQVFEIKFQKANNFKCKSFTLFVALHQIGKKTAGMWNWFLVNEKIYESSVSKYISSAKFWYFIVLLSFFMAIVLSG